MRKLVRISVKSILFYLVVIGFLFPRGFNDINPIYHVICSTCMWIAVFLTWMQLITYLLNKYYLLDYKVKKSYLLISGYFILAIFITIILRRNISSGLQQLFAAPSVCIFMILNLKEYPKKLLNVIANVLCIEFTINAILASVQTYINGIYHEIFLGHVQVVSQYGIISIFVGTLFGMLYNEKKIRNIYLILITAYVMFTTDVETAIASAVILIIALIVYKFKLSKILMIDSRVYVFMLVFINAVVVYSLVKYQDLMYIVDVNGRSFVWQSAVEKIRLHPYLGYGIDGVQLSTFWSSGFNYAHNQIVQNLLDGGIVLMISFWIMILTFVNDINNIKIIRYRVLCNACLIALLFVMIVDSTTLYIYMYIILSIMFCVDKIIKNEGMTV